MMNKGKKWLVVAIAGVLTVSAIPVRGAVLATEEQIEGTNVVLDAYCNNVAAGVVVAQTPENLAGIEQPLATATPAPQQKETPEAEAEEDSHVELNLNYSRLGIANKVDTYLNVRKKPSESAKLVGKMTKNAGCHIYSVKKGWAKIVSGKVKGYVKASYLTMDEKAEELATKVGRNCVEIQTDSLRVRALPTKSARFIP